MRLKLIILLPVVLMSISSICFADKKCFDTSLVNKLRKAGQYDQALKEIEKQLRCEDDMSYYFHLGWTLHEMGKYNEAIDAYTKGIPKQKDYSFVYYRRALSYEMTGNRKAAENDLKMFMSMWAEKQNKLKEILDKYSEVKTKLIEYGLINNSQ